MGEYTDWMALVLAAYAVYSTYSEWPRLKPKSRWGRVLTLGAALGFSAALFGAPAFLPVGFASYIVGVKGGKLVLDKITQRRDIFRGGPDEMGTEGNQANP